MPRPIDRELREDLHLTEVEKALLASATTSDTQQMNRASALTGIYVTKHLRRMVDDLIATNTHLAEANLRQARALTLLTGALVLVGLVSVAAQVIGALQR